MTNDRKGLSSMILSDSSLIARDLVIEMSRTPKCNKIKYN